jgi:uncharacterized protein (DUF4415 family)
MLVTKLFKPNEKITKEQMEAFAKEIEQAEKMPLVVDDDCPAYSYEQLSAMIAEAKRREVRKPVGLRLKPKTIDGYKAFGKGYTGVMAKVLDYSLAHPEIIQQAL